MWQVEWQSKLYKCFLEKTGMVNVQGKRDCITSKFKKFVWRRDWVTKLVKENVCVGKLTVTSFCWQKKNTSTQEYWHKSRDFNCHLRESVIKIYRNIVFITTVFFSDLFMYFHKIEPHGLSSHVARLKKKTT